MPADDRPYEHDCAQCRSLGTTVLGGTRFDLYFCVEGGGIIVRHGHVRGEAVIIVRHGDEKWNEVSCGVGVMPRLRKVAEAIDDVPLDTLVLMEAHDRAMKEGWCR